MRILKVNNRFEQKDITSFVKSIALWLFIVVLFLVTKLIRTNKCEEVAIKEYEAEIILSELKTVPFSKENLKEKLRELNLKFPEIVYAQAVLETGDFKSFVFKENNNLFGMKLAKSRPTTAIGFENNHAEYFSWEMSVVDYALYQAAFLRKIRTEEEYLEFLSNNYAKDGNYISKIRKIIKYESRISKIQQER